MSTYLFILNDPPYGTERSYNALRLARSLANKESEKIPSERRVSGETLDREQAVKARETGKARERGKD